MGVIYNTGYSPMKNKNREKALKGRNKLYYLTIIPFEGWWC